MLKWNTKLGAMLELWARPLIWDTELGWGLCLHWVLHRTFGLCQSKSRNCSLPVRFWVNWFISTFKHSCKYAKNISFTQSGINEINVEEKRSDVRKKADWIWQQPIRSLLLRVDNKIVPVIQQTILGSLSSQVFPWKENILERNSDHFFCSIRAF